MHTCCFHDVLPAGLRDRSVLRKRFFLLNLYNTIYRWVLDHLLAAPGPAHFDPIDPDAGAEPKVNTAAEVALVSPAAAHFIEQVQVAGNDPHAGANTVAVGIGADQVNPEPMARS